MKIVKSNGRITELIPVGWGWGGIGISPARATDGVISRTRTTSNRFMVNAPNSQLNLEVTN